MDALSLVMSALAVAAASYAILKGREDRKDLEADQADLQEHIKAVEGMTADGVAMTIARLQKLEENEKRFAVSRGKRGTKAMKSNGSKLLEASVSYFGAEERETRALREKQSVEESGEGEES